MNPAEETTSTENPPDAAGQLSEEDLEVVTGGLVRPLRPAGRDLPEITGDKEGRRDGAAST